MEKLSIEKPKIEKKEKKEEPEVKEVKEVRFDEFDIGDRLIIATEVGPYRIKILGREQGQKGKEQENCYLFVELKDDQQRKHVGRMLGGYEKIKAGKKNGGIFDFLHKGDEEKLTPGVIRSGENRRLQFEDLEEIETGTKTLMLQTPTIKKISLIKKKEKK